MFFFSLVLADYILSSIPKIVTILVVSDPDNADMRTCFTGLIMNDLYALEPDETFTLSITGIVPDNPGIVRGNETTRITINDDNSKPMQQVNEIIVMVL